MLKEAFIEYLALLVAVHQNVLALGRHAQEDKCLLECGREIEDLEVLLC